MVRRLAWSGCAPRLSAPPDPEHAAELARRVVDAARNISGAVLDYRPTPVSLRDVVDAGRPIAHVAAAAGISRRCLAKWYARSKEAGPAGVLDHSPDSSASQTDLSIEQLVETVCRQTQYEAGHVLRDGRGVALSRDTVEV